MTQATLAKIAECWANGMGLSETQTALLRIGVAIDREAIRVRFVALAEGWL